MHVLSIEDPGFGAIKKEVKLLVRGVKKLDFSVIHAKDALIQLVTALNVRS